jgi:phenylacetate-CoA ligase
MDIPVLKRYLGSLVISAHLPGQRRIPFQPRRRLEELRDRRIRRMVRYAARAVPYYRDLFVREAIDPRSIRGAGDLGKLPILEKDLVRSRPGLFLAAGPASRGALRFLTSGSTGKRMAIWHDRRSLLANMAYGEREREPLIRVCGTFRPRELYVGYETSTFKEVTRFYAENTWMPVRPLRRFVSLRETAENVAQIMNAERPDILVGYGGWIDLFFKTVAARTIRLEPPKMVMYMGEALPGGAREFIEERFGIPILSRYNAVEAFKIGYYCEARTGFHLHEDLCHVRIVGPDGKDVAPGASGRIVITNLVNRASVLINYPIGDCAALRTEACSCGRTFRVLSELEGRVEDILLLADGRSVHPRAVWQVFKDDPEVLQYQLLQRGRRAFDLILSTTGESALRRAAHRSLPALQELLGPDAEIAVRRRDEISSSPGAKFRAVASISPGDGDASHAAEAG